MKIDDEFHFKANWKIDGQGFCACHNKMHGERERKREGCGCSPNHVDK